MNKKKGYWILGNKDSSISVKIIRWIARIWSLLILVFALMRVFSPDPYAVSPITTMEIFMLSLWGVAILGLIIAWRWERLGAWVTILIMPMRELLFYLLYKEWTINFLLIWALVIPPAIMYLVAWYLDRKRKSENHNTAN